MRKVYVIGVGPGAKEYLLPIALKRIRESDCLIGAPRILKGFKNLKKEKIAYNSNFEELIHYVRINRTKKRIAILVSGDPGLYSFLDKISAGLKKNEYEVIPGISAMQLAFARIGESWEDAKIISLHGRSTGNLALEVRKNPKVFLFTDPDFPPEKIAAYLIEKNISNKRAIVLKNLGYPDERIIDTDLRKLSKASPALPQDKELIRIRKGGIKDFRLCVMIIR